MFHKKADKEIIKYNANENKQEIAEKLNPSMKTGVGKNDMAHQHKPSGETD